VKYILFE